MGWRRVRPSGAVVAMVTAAAAAHFAISALASTSPPAQRPGVLAAIALTDDEGGAALFHSTVLVPGRPVSRCVRVAYSGKLGADHPGVRLAAVGLRGTLVPRLAVTVEVGDGGGFSSCTGFRGTTVYAGLIAGLGAAGGVDTGWTPAPGDARTYRITVAMTRTVPDGHAAATLEWSATATATAPARSPAPAPVPGAVPADSGASSPATDSGQRSQPCRAPEMGWGARAGDNLERGLRALARVAAQGGRDSRYPLFLLLLLLLFLLVQRRIDRRDPKLALAPLTADRYAYLPDDEEHVLARPEGGPHGHRA